MTNRLQWISNIFSVSRKEEKVGDEIAEGIVHIICLTQVPPWRVQDSNRIVQEIHFLGMPGQPSWAMGCAHGCLPGAECYSGT